MIFNILLLTLTSVMRVTSRINYVIETTQTNKTNLTRSEILYLYFYNSSLSFSNYHGNFSTNENNFSIEQYTGIRNKYILNLTNNKESCKQYTNLQNKLSVSNCSIKIFEGNDPESEKGSSEIKFNLISATYPNFTYYENIIDYDYFYSRSKTNQNTILTENVDFYVYPDLAKDHFTFEKCANDQCRNSKNQSEIQKFYFRINQSEYLLANYQLNLVQAFILVRNSDDYFNYFREITNELVISKDNIFNLELGDVLPDVFDLHLIYEINSYYNNSNSTQRLQGQDIFITNDKLTIIKKNINTPFLFKFEDNPNKNYLWIVITLVCVMILTSASMLIIREFLYFLKISNK